MANKSSPKFYKKFQTCFKRIVFTFFIFVITQQNGLAAWQKLNHGIEYRQIKLKSLSPFSELHAFKINLDKVKLNYCEVKKPPTTVDKSAQANKADIIINGAFFSPEHKPLGLRVRHGQVLSALKPISWWAVFYIKNNHAYITPNKHYHHSKNISFAIQAGPRLLVNGQIPKLKPGLAERTALGITKEGKLILLVTERTAISTSQLAQIMRQHLHCQYAINLDGGSSTQLYAKFKQFARNVHGFSEIPDPLCVWAQK